MAEVNVVVCCVEGKNYKKCLFNTLGKLSERHKNRTSRTNIENDEECKSLLNISVDVNYNNKDTQVTFIDGNLNEENSSEFFTDTIYEVDMVLVLYPYGMSSLVADECDDIVKNMIGRFPKVYPVILGVINSEARSGKSKLSKQASNSSEGHGKLSTAIMKPFLHFKYDVSKLSDVKNLVHFILKENLISQSKNHRNVTRILDYRKGSKELKHDYQYRITGLSSQEPEINDEEFENCWHVSLWILVAVSLLPIHCLLNLRDYPPRTDSNLLVTSHL